MSGNRVFTSSQRAKAPFFVGVDLGGTNIKAGVVDDSGQSLSWCTRTTERQLGPEEGAKRIAAGVLEAIQLAGLQKDQIARVGLGSPGSHDIPAGLLLDPPNLPGWVNFPIQQRVQSLCGLPVTFENDANAAAYGEYWIGSGRDFKSMVLVTLGTGIGTGIIINDVVLQGAHSHGGECGHMIIDYGPNGRLCGCGNTGHLEAYCSATGVTKRTLERLAEGPETSLNDRIARGEEFSPVMLAQEASLGDAFSIDMILETAMFLGVGIVNMMHTVDPEGIILGGAMTFGGAESEVKRRFLARVREEVKARAFPLPAAKTKIEFASLGGDAGYIGAAGIARVDYQNRTRS